MGQDETTAGNAEEYIKFLKKKFTPVAGLRAKYKIAIQDNVKIRPVIIDVNNSNCDFRTGDENDCDVVITVDQRIFEDILDGRMTFQRGFMAGSLKMKGDFKLLRSMDQLFDLMES